MDPAKHGMLDGYLEVSNVDPSAAATVTLKDIEISREVLAALCANNQSLSTLADPDNVGCQCADAG